jgi:hypothetical protein
MKLHGLLITKDDDLLVEEWFRRNNVFFDSIVVVDGSVSDFTRSCVTKYSRVIYLRDPESHITDQTLRKHGWEALTNFAEIGDWIFICHVDEFYIHDPRALMACSGNVMLWLPLLVLPHPSEAESWITAKEKSPTSLFKHYWWRNRQLPHVEHRMWRYIKEPFWNTEIRRPSCGVIPYNYSDETICGAVPLYYHYKCFDLSLSAYRGGGEFSKSQLNTGLPRPIAAFDDLFFYDDRPFTDGYFAYDNDHSKVFSRFGNPPRLVIGERGPAIINDQGVPLEDVT